MMADEEGKSIKADMYFEPRSVLLRDLRRPWAGPQNIPVEIEPKFPEQPILNDNSRLVPQFTGAISPDEERSIGVTRKIIIKIEPDPRIRTRGRLLGGRPIYEK